MYKLKRSKSTLWGQQGKVCDSCEKLGRETRDNLGNNRRDFRADVLSLLSSALRPRLLGAMGVLAMILMGIGNFSQVSAVSLTLTVPEGLSINISPNGEGVYKKSETGTISVQSDAFAGFTLDIKSKTDNNLSNGAAHIESITAETTEEEFQSTGKINTWGFLPSKLNGVDNTKLQAGPTTAPTVIGRTTEKGEGAKDYEIAFAAKVDSTLPTGNYTNTFVISSVANTVSYSIQYDANQGTGGPSESPQTGNTAEETILLDSAKPTRGDSYEFVGWCTVQTSNEKCEGGNTYQPGGEFKLGKSNNTVILYAMWRSTVPTTMQDFGDYCNQMKVDQVLTLKDTRDGNSYTVAKLKDEKCWMTQNLVLGRDQAIELNKDNTDIRTSFSLPKADGSPGIINDRAHIAWTSSLHKDQVYYNWYAATAGSGDLNNTNIIASESICPRSFKLPSPADFLNFYKYYSGNEFVSGLPEYTTYGGYGAHGSGGVFESGIAEYWTNELGFVNNPTRTGVNNSGPNSWCGVGLCSYKSSCCSANGPAHYNVRCIANN